MSFLSQYQTYIKLLFFFGLAPIRINGNGTHVTHSTLSLFYTICLSTTISILWTLATYGIFFGPLNLHWSSTHTASEFIQVTSTILIYLSALVATIIKRKLHASFLNLLHNFDVRLKICFKIKRIDGKYFFIKIFASHFVIILGIISFYVNFEFLIDMNVWGRISAAVYFFVRVCIFLIVLHIKWMANLLVKRCFWIKIRFSSIINSTYPIDYNDLFDILMLLEMIWQLVQMFNKLFGFFILLNAIFDFVMFTMYFYMFLYFSIYNIELNFMSGLLLVSACLLPHVLSCYYVASAVGDLGNQVFIFPQLCF